MAAGARRAWVLLALRAALGGCAPGRPLHCLRWESRRGHGGVPALPGPPAGLHHCGGCNAARPPGGVFLPALRASCLPAIIFFSSNVAHDILPAQVKHSGYDLRSFCLAVTVPPVLLLRQRAAFLYLRDTAADTPASLASPEGAVELKDCLRWLVSDQLQVQTEGGVARSCGRARHPARTFVGRRTHWRRPMHAHTPCAPSVRVVAGRCAEGRDSPGGRIEGRAVEEFTASGRNLRRPSSPSSTTPSRPCSCSSTSPSLAETTPRRQSTLSRADSRETPACPRERLALGCRRWRGPRL